MKEIIKGTIVIDPAFRAQVAFVSVKKLRVFIVSLKFNQSKVVSLYEGSKV